MVNNNAYYEGCFSVPPKFDFKILPFKSRKVVIVSFVGECDTFIGDCPMLNISGYPLKDRRNGNISGAYIDGYYDCEQQIIYLMLHSLKTEEIADLLNESRMNAEELFNAREFITLKLLYYVFSVSHFVVVTSTGTNLDPSYLIIFKFLERIRQNLRPSIDLYLRNLPLPREWLSSGRTCIPRLLFVFKIPPATSRKISKDCSMVDKLKQNLAVQIFNAFYEVGLIRNSATNSLFVLPGHNFVHVLLSSFVVDMGIPSAVHDDHCQEYLELILDNVNLNEVAAAKPTNRSRVAQSLFADALLNPEFNPHDYHPPEQPEDYTLAAFLNLHVTTLLDQASNRTSGFCQAAPIYELPTCKAWFMACYKLYTCLMTDGTTSPDGALDFTPDAPDVTSSNVSTSLSKAWNRASLTRVVPPSVRNPSIPGSLSQDLDVEDKAISDSSRKLSFPADPMHKLSVLRCRTALSAAEAHYKRDMPAHYSSTFHLVKVVSTFNLFISLARGPLVFPTLKQLSKRLAHIYLSGRATCTATSLTGHLCQRELHRLPNDSADLRSMLASHASNGTRARVLHDGVHVSRLSASEREVKVNMDSWVPAGLFGKWRVYWLESLLVDNESLNNGSARDPPHSEDNEKQLAVESQSDVGDQHLTVMQHASDTELISSCNCGLQQTERPDPFDYKEANWRFYSLLATVCCNQLITIPLAPQFLCEGNHPFHIPNSFVSDSRTIVNPIKFCFSSGLTLSSTPHEPHKGPVAVLTRQMGKMELEAKLDRIDNVINLSANGPLSDTANVEELGLSQPEENPLLLLSDVTVNQSELLKESNHTTAKEEEAYFEDLSGTEILTSMSGSTDASPASRDHTLDSGEEEEGIELPLAGCRRVSTRPESTDNHGGSTNLTTIEPMTYEARFRDGVPTTAWRIGDIPRYPSWSISALGKYFSYSHSSGLSSRGFLRKSNFLLPWDVNISSGAWSIGERGRTGRGKHRNVRSDTDSVKLFIGFEMECPLGHRFFLAGPDRPMDGPMQSNQVRRAVHGLLTKSLPLFMPCRCQTSHVAVRAESRSVHRPGGWGSDVSDSNKQVIWAQLSRIYLAIPSAPVKVRFEPRIRPGPAGSTPIFHMGHTMDQCIEGINATSSDSEREYLSDTDNTFEENDEVMIGSQLRYRKPVTRLGKAIDSREYQKPGFVLLNSGFLWVVRLPFVYYDGERTFSRPSDSEANKDWRLLRGSIKLQI